MAALGPSGAGQLETALADALIEIRPLQDESGFWHQIPDDTTAPLECSGTLIFAYAFERAVATGVIDDDGFRDAAEPDGGGDQRDR